jgi:Zn ribbon nucleic-acid-binding protein
VTKRTDYRQERKPMPPPSRYIHGAVCPACEDDWLHPETIRNCRSRYCDLYICTPCGTKEAFQDFFWWKRALERGARLNEAGQVFVQQQQR